MRRVTVELPVAFDSNQRDETHLHMNLRGQESRTFRGLREGFLSDNATLLDGKPVWSFADVVRWLVQRAAE